ncbi:hypothetical protein PSTG_01690 [Puccinia striiformis f. sp. tritici PST-78]|uniref:Uncharacterized protein n=1 Tax=Puccinia striiformis f. sp. tritici PST-78 TaxID=1165861 RepID=A0A0L0W0L8_9BASI|nr:hypothetical protein PSTG_01690 [Puccinia striiformis f. sp. tritici PST-78]
MEPTDPQDDLCLSNAVQNHIRIVTGLPRSKKDFPQSPTVEQLNKLPELPSNSTVLPASAQYLIKAKAVSLNLDPEEKMGDTFPSYCLRRAKQYGIPFVGISILTQNHKALVWNRRTRAFCVDTFYCALEADETLSFFCTGFDINKYGSSRVELIVLKNFEYRIAEMTKDFGRASKEKAQDHSDGSSDSSEKGKLRAKKLRKADKQQDRRLARLKALAQRRRDTIQSNLKPHLKKYLPLFANEYLCPSDESSDDIDNPTRIKNAPVWRSKRATALCEEIDQLTAQIRQNSPKRAGRKPGKRINLGPRAPPGGLQASPCYFPVDCYHEYWLASQSPEAISALEIKQQPIFD